MLLSARQISADPIASCYPLSVPTSSSEPRGAGGTPGGIGQFLVGLVMVAAGGYLILNQVQVTTSSWRFGQYGGFGLTLLPLLAGIAVLFYNGKSIIGWLLTLAGTAIILASILMNMDIYFRQTTLYNTIVMLGLLFGGLGVLARSLRSA
jgi:uncharacterized protein